MEVLIRKLQNELEDAIRLETTPDEIKETKYGRQLLKYVRKRHRRINLAIKILKEK